jgi:hypothetical protein
VRHPVVLKFFTAIRDWDGDDLNIFEEAILEFQEAYRSEDCSSSAFAAYGKAKEDILYEWTEYMFDVTVGIRDKERASVAGRASIIAHQAYDQEATCQIIRRHISFEVLDALLLAKYNKLASIKDEETT